MPAIYEEANEEVSEAMRTMRDKHHSEIAELVTIGIFMVTPEMDEGGNAKGPAVAINGYPCAAKIKINGYPDRVQGKPDATIFIDAEQWKDSTDDTHAALMDHELHHLEVRRDPKSGSVKRDDLGRPKLKMRKHDHQFGWFNVIAKRHGDASYEVQQAKKFADKDGQLYFGWKTPPAGAERATANSGRNVTTKDGRKITAQAMVQEISAQFAK